ncbi:MAG: LysE family translocator [Acidiferrobacteraceae bacterium]|nr:LysE family translocator [Acidiferrobacteraceae bacterium]MBT3769264.1 LysE family translocator [Acidiferrobacteraceae bacterium]MBT3972779.1 LysE family translocator [Acidiferrobacteraceae bacterium]MBT4393780.1 LysE family translocator [Acidiferrobacteraceae bacterium]MBT5979630.1 LysE family translocator [Acidiferrobacteraceae bacterium]
MFFAAALILAITPGPGVFYILATSVAQGPKAGVISACGIAAGTLVHVLFAVLGLSLLIASSGPAFYSVKYLGAAYLFYLGIQTLRGCETSGEKSKEVSQKPLLRVFTRAAVVNILNPKVGLFFVALLPQFVDPARGAPALQFLLLGVLLACLAFVTDTLYALAAGKVGERLRSPKSSSAWRRWLAGITYLTLGVLSVLMDRPERVLNGP